MDRKVSYIILLVVFAMSLAACGGRDGTEEATGESSPTPRPIPTVALSPTPPEAEDVGGLNAGVVGDTTTVEAGESFIETWRLRNTGIVDWESAEGEFRWAFVGGDRLEGPGAVPIVGTVLAGEDYEVTAEFTAPTTPGQYESNWQLLDPVGDPVGPIISMLLTVEPPSDEAPEATSPEPTPTEAAPVEYEEGCLDSSPVSDVTIPDGTVVDPGETFTKIWRIRNAGTCAWNEADGEIVWVFIDGNQMGGPDQVLIEGTVEPGEDYDVEIELTAPTTPGEYRGDWMLFDPNGDPFGVPFWVIVEVPGAEPTSGQGGTNLAQEVWQNINGERAQGDLPQLAYNTLLAQAAQIQADDCAQRGSCSHTGSDGSSDTERAIRAGYVGTVDEAWAMTRSPRDAVQWWMDEPLEHRPMLLSTSFNEVGVGVALSSSGIYFIAVFGSAGR